ncbi:MAG: type IV pili twitching motility protein PilT [Elusimicrobia bacterium CG1_02_63_36]|nr:MAG: type IV pili twitching motility protein PilT [Elusimicrobia bacterium CG1_02_63_36]PIP83778.1 MAG: type IV pili twitching motility protein PilT [Elusimicrobia bacterium CG22_combo_CG10-13_8_21_14_all_63_91]PJA16791.1 MAG: type IV pili twitching motility protein PilT [Elusimicrobia bacterium CG_4_10_14_0_2_um_filter_63_34]PJB25602.1 MAG: type IV pili twitching motility protein PilT [Elusimicrobia bacterium CG_4_9_14_3_um_filter_62_55]
MAEIDDLFERLERFKGSDLHLRCGIPAMIRVHGTMLPLKSEPVEGEKVERMIMEIMPEDSKKIFQETFDVDFGHTLPTGKRLRCNVFQERLGIGATFRLIPSTVPTAKDVYLTPSILKLCGFSKGLVLVTGPTGSGKSTTMAAMLDHVNATRKEHIITIEDPIEFVHPNKKCLVTQREVKTHTQSFASALRSALREDPDIILVGEMRDLETTMIAIETAETGHLVFGTLHTTTAASTIDRIIDQFPADRQEQIRTMLAASLAGVVSQTLLRKEDGMGMVAAREVLHTTGAIRALIRDKKTYQINSEIETGISAGMMPLNEAIFRYLQAGLITNEEALYKAVDKEDMRRRLKDIPVKAAQFKSAG